MFPIDAARSPHRRPPRGWVCAFWRGVEPPEGTDLEITNVPGVAEIFQNPRFRSFEEPLNAVGFACVPGGPLDGLWQRPYADDPAAFEKAFLAALETYAPSIYDRIDVGSFMLTRPRDLLQGAFVPVVRQAWAPLGDGRYAMAVGDAWVLVDPLMAQGANMGSRSAFVLGEAIAAGGPYDEAFCRRTEATMWAGAEGPCTLTNAFLEPLQPPAIDLMTRASRDRSLGDRLVDLGEPEGILALFGPQ